MDRRRVERVAAGVILAIALLLFLLVAMPNPAHGIPY